MRIKKIILIVSMLVLIISINCNVYATGIMQDAKDFLNLADEQKNEVYGNGDNAKDPILNIADLLMGIGIFIAVGVGIILGIKFMFSTAEGKAEISKLLVPYLVGIILVVGALGIWKFAISVVDI